VGETVCLLKLSLDQSKIFIWSGMVGVNSQYPPILVEGHLIMIDLGINNAQNLKTTSIKEAIFNI
jgi:hypothetical protein